MKLLEYADFLKDTGIDNRTICVYAQMAGILKHFLKDEELTALQQDIASDYTSLRWKAGQENADFPYAFLVEPCANIDDLIVGVNRAWGQINGFYRAGLRQTLENRKKWHLYGVAAACMLIVAYAESIRCGKVNRDDALTYAAVMNDLAFIISDAAFYGTSVPVIEKRKKTDKRKQAAKKGIEKSFKQQFKANCFKPACREFLAKERKWGDKAAFIRKIQDDYDLAMLKAKRKIFLGKNDEILDASAVRRWIKEMEKEIEAEKQQD